MSRKLKAKTVTIITVCYNSVGTIKGTIESVLSQDYPGIEYIIIDGGSTDGTVEILQDFSGAITRFVSEPDEGIYDAMNKGIRFATGDVIGILNSDDVYFDSKVVSTVMREFEATNVDSVFADLVFVKRDDPEKVVRYYNSAACTPDKFAYGWMMAHPTFFVKRSCYENYGLFKTDYRIGADFELLARFLYKNGISYSYIPHLLVKMRIGGLSTRNFRSNLILNREIMRACTENGIKTNMLKIYSKYVTKIFQLINRPT